MDDRKIQLITDYYNIFKEVRKCKVKDLPKECYFYYKPFSGEKLPRLYFMSITKHSCLILCVGRSDDGEYGYECYFNPEDIVTLVSSDIYYIII